MTWPLNLEVDTEVTQIAPFVLTGPIPSLELQIVEGTTVRAIVGREDGRFDIYWPKGHSIKPFKGKLGNGIGYNAAVQFERDTFTIGTDGVHIDVALTDNYGKELAIRVDSPRPWRGYNFLDAVGSRLSRPVALLMPYTFDLDFLPTAGLTFEATYDGTPLTYRKRMAFRRGSRTISVRAGLFPSIVQFQRDKVRAVKASDPEVRLDDDGALEALVAGHEDRPCRLELTPALPPVQDLTERTETRWELTVAGERVAAGLIRLTPHENGNTQVYIGVTKGWPGARGAAVPWLLTRTSPVFRNWPRRYSWRGALTKKGALKGSWTNTAAPR